MSEHGRPLPVWARSIVSAVLIVAGILLARTTVLGFVIWFVGAMGLGHTLAIALGFIPLSRQPEQADKAERSSSEDSVG